MTEREALNAMAMTALHAAAGQFRMADTLTLTCGDLRSDTYSWPQRYRLGPVTIEVTPDDLDAVMSGGLDDWRVSQPDRLLTVLNPVTAARVRATRAL